MYIYCIINSVASYLFIHIFVCDLVAFVSRNFKFIERRKSKFFRVLIFHFLDCWPGPSHHPPYAAADE